MSTVQYALLLKLREDRDAAKAEWLKHYRSIPKYGRTSKQSYRDAGLWMRYKNRERKYDAALETANPSPRE